jgi:conjugative relaxase-like TrwC/TraI family protein
MLTIRAAKNAAYYQRHEFAADDYYAERGQAPGEWVGQGAELLELQGAPEEGALAVLLDGRDPATGAPLSTTTGGRPASNAGFDLTFTAPKSVSVLLAVGDATTRQAVLDAQEAGVRAGLDYLEREACFVRRGRDGVEVRRADGFLGAVYHHEMARSGDPHLHTHLVIANRARGPDMRWTAPDMRPVFAHAKAAGAIQEAVMRDALTRRLGVGWERQPRWGYEVVGICAEVRGHFSARHAEIAELATARGWLTPAGVSAVQRETRDHKPLLDRSRAQAEWRARAAEHGLAHADVERVVPGPRERSALAADRRWQALAKHLAGPDGLTRHAATFGAAEVALAIAEHSPEGLAAGELARQVDDFLMRHAVCVQDAEGHRPAIFSTEAQLAVEARLHALAGAPSGEGAPTVSPATLEAVIGARPTLGADQREALEQLVLTETRIRALEAPAGTGKTFVLGALREAYEATGATVVGTSWQGQAAQTLAHEAGIPADTAARLLGRINRDPRVLPARPVLVVDEAGMMPTWALERLVGEVAARGGIAVLVGDRDQLPAMDAGGAFAGLADRLGAAALTENRRQVDDLQRQVAQRLAAGQPDEALALLERGRALNVHDDARDAKHRLVADWAAQALPRPGRALIIAHDRRDVRELNTLARDALDRAGLLGAERMRAHGREWAAGDRLICRKNDYRPGLEVRNGTRGTVVSVNVRAGSLHVLADDGREMTLPAEYLQHVHHGYAVTGHVSQGATVDRTYLLATPARGGKEWAYVAGTRHRIALRVYLTHHAPAEAEASLSRSWARVRGKRTGLEALPQREQTARIQAAKAALSGRTPVSPPAKPPYLDPRSNRAARNVPRLRS